MADTPNEEKKLDENDEDDEIDIKLKKKFGNFEDCKKKVKRLVKKVNCKATSGEDKAKA